MVLPMSFLIIMQKSKLSHDSLQQTLTFHVVILIKSVFIKDENYYCNVFLEKDLGELPKNNDNK